MSTPKPVQAWGRGRLIGALAGVVVAALVLLLGLFFALSAGLTASGSEHSATADAVEAKQWPVGANGIRGDQFRDSLAAAPMLEANRSDFDPAPPALKSAGRIEIGVSERVGVGGVATGFDQSPEGAVAQLAAIETSVLGPMSLQYARDVFSEWSDPAAEFERWELAASIQSFHAHAGTVDGDGTVLVTAAPVGAQIKGVDGDSWVLACVQLDVQITVVDTTRFGYGHCERMQWDGKRWEIAAGGPPAVAPSTWPRSQRSLDAGWLTWTDREVH